MNANVVSHALAGHDCRVSGPFDARPQNARGGESDEAGSEIEVHRRDARRCGGNRRWIICRRGPFGAHSELGQAYAFVPAGLLTGTGEAR